MSAAPQKLPGAGQARPPDPKRAAAERLIRLVWAQTGSEFAGRCHCLYEGWISCDQITPAGRKALRELEAQR